MSSTCVQRFSAPPPRIRQQSAGSVPPTRSTSSAVSSQATAWPYRPLGPTPRRRVQSKGATRRATARAALHQPRTPTRRVLRFGDGARHSPSICRSVASGRSLQATWKAPWDAASRAEARPARGRTLAGRPSASPRCRATHEARWRGPLCLVARSARAESVDIASSCPRPPSAARADAASTASSIVSFFRLPRASSRSNPPTKAVSRLEHDVLRHEGGCCKNGSRPLRGQAVASLLWTQRQDIGPSARFGHALAYEENRAADAPRGR